MALFLTGKQKAALVPLDYHERPDWPKRWLTVAAVGATAVALLACAVSGRWRAATAPGPVHAVHAAWENECTVCHVPFHPSGSDNGLSPWLGARAETDTRCQTCHAGPQHHARQKPEEVAACGTCHREHGGRDASLVALPDRDCTACHANLPAHVAGGTSVFTATITRFDRDHPEFSIQATPQQRVPLGRATDPGRLRFNHQVHLTLGLRHDKDDVRPWRLGDIRDGQARERYRRAQPEQLRRDHDPVQLGCAACHQADASELPPAAGRSVTRGAARGPGATMLPVTYENHCQVCHPLTFDPVRPELAIPHGLQPPEVHRFLWGAYAESTVAEGKRNRPAASDPPRPGQGLSDEEERTRARIEGRVSAMESELFQQDVARAERYVYAGKTTCGLCHEYEGGAGARAPARIVPPAGPEVWYAHAVFSHQAHRAVDCRACHEAAETSTMRDQVLLPGVAICQRCHSPAGGVRFACTECHRYHHGDEPLAGRGAAARGVAQRLRVEDFLAGKPARP
jgi:hypothetical protein